MRRSISGPLLLLGIGAFFLYRNLHPETPLFDLAVEYWPFLLIAWGLLRLAEVLIWRNDTVRGSFSGGEIVLVVFICIAGSGIWQAREHGVRFMRGGLDFWGQEYEYQVTARTGASGIKRIVFENPRGDIRITGSDSNEVVVSGRKLINAYRREEAERTNGITPVELVTQGDRIVVRTNQDRAPNNQRIADDLEIALPRGMAVESRNGSGDYTVEDIAGDLEVSTTRGDIHLTKLAGNVRLDVSRCDEIRASDIKGRIDLQGRGNNVELDNVAGQVTINGSFGGTLNFKNLAKPIKFENTGGTELSAQAVPGSITMDLGEFNGNGLTGPVRLISGARDIKLEQFTQAIEVETTRGDIAITPGKLPLSTIEARSGSGKIELLLPEKASFHLEATAERGDAVNDYNQQLIRKETQGRTATLKGKTGEGPSIHLTARHGWISVRKEGTEASQEPSENSDEAPQPPSPPKAPKSQKDLRDSEIKM